MKSRSLRSSSLLVAALLLACSSGERIDPSVEKLGRATGPVTPGRQPAVAPEPEGEPEQKGPAVAHEGVVLERIHVPNYTYLRLGLADGRESWAAVPRTEIEVGARARVIESLVMHEFRSPTLDRTFASIVFGVLDGAAADPADAGSADGVGAREPPPPRDGTPLPPGHPPI